jgi:hypothetical protein
VNDTNLRFPEWQARLQDLILEFDREKLRDKMQEVETIISQRFQLLHVKHAEVEKDTQGEHEALNDALTILRVIKRDRLDSSD